VRLRTTLNLASFFPIAITALFILYLFAVHSTVVAGGGGPMRGPMIGAVLMAVFSLLIGWLFYRAGRNLVNQVAALELMAERVKRGDLKPTGKMAGARGEVADFAEVFDELVVELCGYVELIGEHERLKQDCEVAHATAEKLRESAVQASGVMELLSRAEQGYIAGLLDEDAFLSSWLPPGTLRAALGVDPEQASAPALPPDILGLFRKLLSGPLPAGAANADDSPPEVVSAREAMEDAVRLCRWKWERGGGTALNVSIEADGARPFEVRINRLSLVQTFAALLMNAADAMPAGGSVAIQFNTDAEGTVNLSITDHGVGMNASVRTRCTKPFFSTKEGRVGMGLTLASRVVARGGGRLGVIGEPGHGTAVHISFPCHSRQGRPGALAPSPRGPLRILVVEDDDVVRDALLAMLHQEHHSVTAVADGAAAVLRLRQQKFDIVMTDRAMPIMSGEELALAVKSRHPATHVVLVTAAGDEMIRRRVQPEGVDAILTKPVLRADLRLAIARAMADR
jgi:signal transduction histidine kinase